jgi:hypothetical protein
MKARSELIKFFTGLNDPKPVHVLTNDTYRREKV